ncbi:MFS multidrug protein [Rutstroemia sp. NJR-2017a WRK4]|nr:MFS multidrug protein [Rutstroemia sp. NJR-2017a WRK4]
MDKDRDESQANHSNQENGNAIDSKAKQPDLSEPREPEVIKDEPHVDLETGNNTGDHTNVSLVPVSETVSQKHEAATDIPYSVFTVSQKKMIIVTGSLASLFSPMSSSIYYPSLSQIAKDLDISEAKVIQGVAPMMTAGFSDKAGRRPAYIICFIIYAFTTLGLALQNSYPALMVLRCLQSAGSSGTVALANGMVGDIITSSERGTYVAFASLGSILGPMVAPVIGGVLGQYAGWHWIFWFLLIFACAVFIPLILFLPETCRNVVDDGSIPPPFLSMNISDHIRHSRLRKAGIPINEEKLLTLRKNYKIQVPNPLTTLKVATDKEAGILLFAVGLSLACFYAISTGASSQFGSLYHFSQLKVALMFMPVGAGSVLSAFTTGKLIDYNYRRHALMHNLPVTKNRQQDLTHFPIERARLEIALPLFYLGAAAIIAYGWVMGHRVSVAGPAVLLFVIGYALVASFQILNILMVDIYPGRPATATAANNLVRCEIGAVATAVIVPMVDAMGTGWSYTILALLFVVYSPALLVIMRYGMRWRKVRKDKEAAAALRKEEKNAKDTES